MNACLSNVTLISPPDGKAEVLRRPRFLKSSESTDNTPTTQAPDNMVSPGPYRAFPRSPRIVLVAHHHPCGHRVQTPMTSGFSQDVPETSSCGLPSILCCRFAPEPVLDMIRFGHPLCHSGCLSQFLWILVACKKVFHFWIGPRELCNSTIDSRANPRRNLNLMGT